MPSARADQASMLRGDYAFAGNNGRNNFKVILNFTTVQSTGNSQGESSNFVRIVASRHRPNPIFTTGHGSSRFSPSCP